MSVHKNMAAFFLKGNYQREGKRKKIKRWHEGTRPDEDKARRLTHLESKSDQQGALSQSPGSAAGRESAWVHLAEECVS